MTFELSRAFANQRITGIPRTPSIVGITRLETQPTAISMKVGLQAPLADPLWLLARQWQFNEFQGEDAGTPLRIKFGVDGTAVDAFRPGIDPQAIWTPLTPDSAPLETQVEAEAVWAVHPRFRGEAGMQALRMSGAQLRAALLAAYPLNLQRVADPAADQAGLMWTALLNGRTVDAGALAADLLPLIIPADGTLTRLPDALVVDDIETARSTLQAWYAWFRKLAHEGDAAAGNSSSWQKNRMEYAFALKAGTVRLHADEYTDGHLDWDDFTAGPLDAPDDPNLPALTQSFAVESRHPSPVRYPGMPAERYWEFEDGQVNFAGADAGITDLVRLCVTEFALTFGNDWLVVPVRLPVGWLYRVESFQVTDSFGVITPITPIVNDNGQQWTLYSMTADPALQGQLQHTLYLPDSLDGVQEGAVLEETLLARDEMANLAWAIEKKVQGVSGDPLDRDLEARQLAFQQKIAFGTEPDSPQLVYRLATPVPANWTPLLPVRDPGIAFAAPLEIRLMRAGMKRFYTEHDALESGVIDQAYEDFIATLDAQSNFITPLPIGDGLRAYVFYPRGHLLRSDPDHPMDPADTLVIEEEEVPRIGAVLRRKFQYARSSDGRSWLWIGRSKLAGRGGAGSGLRFDVAVNRDTLR